MTYGAVRLRGAFSRPRIHGCCICQAMFKGPSECGMLGMSLWRGWQRRTERGVAAKPVPSAKRAMSSLRDAEGCRCMASAQRREVAGSLRDAAESEVSLHSQCPVEGGYRACWGTRRRSRRRCMSTVQRREVTGLPGRCDGEQSVAA